MGKHNLSTVKFTRGGNFIAYVVALVAIQCGPRQQSTLRSQPQQRVARVTNPAVIATRTQAPNTTVNPARIVTPRLTLQQQILALRARLPSSIGAERIRELVRSDDNEVESSIAAGFRRLYWSIHPDLGLIARWNRATRDAASATEYRSYIAALHEAQRRDGIGRRVIDGLQESEFNALISVAIPPWFFEELSRRVANGASQSSLSLGDVEWNRIETTARWATQRVVELGNQLGARPGPAGVRIRELYSQWLLETGQVDQAAQMLLEMENAPVHNAPRWRYLEARALFAAGRTAEAQRVMSTVPQPDALEPASERMERVKARAAELEFQTRTAATAQQFRDRVWALIVLGRIHEAARTAERVPTALANDALVLEARAVAASMDFTAPERIWELTQNPVGMSRDGYVSARILAGLSIVAPSGWRFPRPTPQRSTTNTTAVVNELRTLLARAPMRQGQLVQPLMWHVQLLAIGNAPQGIARARGARELLEQLRDTRTGSNKALQFYAATLESVLWTLSGDPRAGLTALGSVDPTPEHQNLLRDAIAIQTALSVLMDGRSDQVGQISALLTSRSRNEMNRDESSIVTALLRYALSLSQYMSSPDPSPGLMSSQISRLIYALEYEPPPNSVSSDNHWAILRLGAVAFAERTVRAALFATDVPRVWSDRYNQLLLGYREKNDETVPWQRGTLDRCAQNHTVPAIALHCARWAAAVYQSAANRNPGLHQRFAALATHTASAARALDGPLASTGIVRQNGTILPTGTVRTGADIDVETWRIEHRWHADLGWVFIPTTNDHPTPSRSRNNRRVRDPR